MPRKILILSLLTLGYVIVSNQAQAEDLSIVGNGTGSSSEVNITQSTSTDVSQTNNADISNETQTTANSGDNTASGNSGDTSIQTGDVLASETINNEANQSVADSSCCSTSTTATILGNGADSQNNIALNQTDTTTVRVDQESNITNYSSGTANSGGNGAEDNNGDISIETGDVDASQETSNKNINQSHVEGAIGSGNSSAKITGNGADSVNSIHLTRDNNRDIWVLNSADIYNDINWDANSGNNFANGNLGDVFIRTGDVGLEIVIENEGINSSEVILRCCEEAIITPPTPPVNPPQGGEEPPSSPTAPTSSQTSVTQAAAAGGVAGEVLAEAGEVLPISGDLWTLIITLISSFLFFLGLFLRLHPGRDPNLKKAQFVL
ncbi:MAG: hypothetical protein Q7S44_01245 [bacterium]|nr:hypothetical protein [bacterium]